MSEAAAAVAEATTDAAGETGATAPATPANAPTAPATAADGDKGDAGGQSSTKGDAAPATTASGGGESDSTNIIWPEKWREHLSGGDEKVAEELGRYAEPGLIGPALIEAKNRIRAGVKPEMLPDNATEEQVVEYRKNNGVPAEAEGYFEGLPDGLVIGEEDKEGMGTLASAMHAIHAPAAVTHAAMGAYYKHVEDVIAERAEDDAHSKKNSDDELNQLYGGEFRRNINDLNAWLGSAGDEVKAAVLGARTPDGTPLGNHPEFLKFMIGQMRDINPLVTVPGLGGGDPAAALSDEIASIEKTMNTDFAAYSADKTMQARYLELLEARNKQRG